MMAKRNLLSFARGQSSGDNGESASEAVAAPLGGTRAQAMQRLQVGLAGIAVMVLVIGLATIFTQRAADVEELAVPDAAPTTEPIEEAQQNDPLADAGVVPDLPAETEVEVQDPALDPEQGLETEVEDTEAP